MHTFHDSKGRPWQLEINCDTLEQVKESCGVNLLDLADAETNLLTEVNLFPPLLAKLLFAALSEQAKDKQVDEREFRRSMGGDPLSDATDALLAEIALFCPKHRRTLLQAVLAKNKEVEEASLKAAMTRLEDPELTRQTLAALDRQVTKRIAEALESIDPQNPPAPPASPSVTGFSTDAGPQPVCFTSLPPDLTPGASSNV